MNVSRIGPLAVSLAIAFGAASPALAQSKKPPPPPPPSKVDPKLAEAKKLFDDGAAAYATGNYEEAIKNWEKSYEISQKPLIFESIANAYERLGDARKAREYLSKWREAAPAEERELLDARIKNLDSRVQREDEAAAKAAAEKAAQEKAARDAAEAGKQKPFLVGGIVGGAGLAAVLAGVVVDAVAAKKRPDPSLCKTVSGNTICRSSAADAISQSNTMAIAGDITWAVGAAAVATGATLIVIKLRGQSQPKDSTKAPAAWLAPLPGGVMVGGQF